VIRRVRRAVIARKQVQVFKSHLDARYAGLFSVSSHDGVTVEAEPVDSAEEISRRVRDTTEVAAVDEAQFLDDGIVDLSNRLADRGVRVISPAPTSTSGACRSVRCRPSCASPRWSTNSRRSAWCVGDRRPGISGSSTASRRFGTVRSSWLVGGNRTRRDAGTVTEFPTR